VVVAGIARAPLAPLTAVLLTLSACDRDAPLTPDEPGPDKPGSPAPEFSGSTVPNLKVAFIGDQGLRADAVAVLRLIEDEGAHMVLHQGDFDYHDDPTRWDDQITSVLGADFPYFASVGNHDVDAFYGAGGYQDKLERRLSRVSGATCTGELAVNSACQYEGLFFILSGVGTLGSGHEDYIRQQLEADNSTWRICSWHKNQNAMQVGGKGNEVGWGPYEACRELGAIIATAHEHSYHRTKTLISTEQQTVDPGWPHPANLRVVPGATFVFVSGAAGANIRNQDRCLPTTYPYGCNGEWASIYTSDQGAKYGALFIEFHVDGDPNKARGYFKNIDGEVVDQFVVMTEGGTGTRPRDTIYITSTSGGSVGGVNFEDEDILAYDGETDTWSMHFDGSDVGLDGSSKRDVRAFELLANGDILLSVNGATTLPDVGSVDASDIVRFNGTAGPSTSGTFSLYLRGADVGLGGESIDAIGFAPHGRLVVSTGGSFSVPGASGADEDLIALDAGGASWSLYFDGSDVDLNDSSSEDVAGVLIDAASGDVYLTTAGAFSVPGVSGGSSDVFVCKPDALGSTTSCTYTSYWFGSAHGLTSDVIGIHIEVAPPNQVPTADFTWAPSGLAVDFTDASSDVDGTLTEWSWDFGDGGTSTLENPSHKYAVAGEYTVTLTVTDNEGATGERSETVSVGLGLPTRDVIYITSTRPGSVGGVAFEDEDILAYDGKRDTWSLYFDGSDVGLDGSSDRDVRAFELLPNGDILLSVFGATTLPDVGNVDPSDIVRFSGSTGPNTSGTFSWYLRGADVGLAGERIDAIGFAPDGRLVVSMAGSFSVPGASGGDEDLIALDAGGASWSLYFDGSDVDLNDSADEDVAGVWIDDVAGDIYISTRGSFAVPDVSGGASEIIVCQPGALGSTTSCAYAAYWFGSAHGLTSNDVIGIHIEVAPPNQAPKASFTWMAADLMVGFMDASSDADGTVTEWSWDFGDGGTSTLPNPLYTYAAAGYYTVTLTVTDNEGATGTTSQKLFFSVATPIGE
jgi:PKD repeat protein